MRRFALALCIVLSTAVLLAAVPTISSVVPNRGPTGGGTSVTIHGTGFTGTTSVTFGGTAATQVTVVNDTTITAVTPAHAEGFVDVKVVNPDGAATYTNGFLYALEPTAHDDAYSTPFNLQLNVAAPGVLTNDESNGGGPMTAVLEANAAHGLVSLFGDGSFSYVPNTGFAGSDSFTYRATNSIAIGNVATVTITVTSPGTTQSPTNLVVWSIIGNLVTLRWDAPTVGPTPTGYRVDCGANPGQLLVTYPLNTTTTAFTFGATNNILYCRVYALAGSDRSPASNEVAVFVNTQSVAPSAPQDLAAVANQSTVGLTWRNTFSGGTPASIVLDVTGAIIASFSLGPTESFSFAGVPAGTYTLTVRAINAAGTSVSSNSVTLTFPAACTGAPPTPPNFVAYKVGSGIYVIWGPSPVGTPAATSYVLTVTGSFVGSFPTAGRILSAVAPPGTYNLSVLALNACGTSAPTAPQVVEIP